MDRTIWAENALTIQKELAVCVCGGEDWRIINSNESFASYFIGEHHSAVNTSLLLQLQEINAQSVSKPLQESTEGLAVMYSLDGRDFILSWHWLDRENNIRAIFGHKLTVACSFEESVAAGKELEIIFDNMHDGVWVIDGNGVTIKVNKAMERIAQVKAEEVVGKHVTEAVSLGLTSTCVTLEALKNRQPVTMFDDYSDGVRCLNTSTPVFDAEGKVWRVIACIRDISEMESLKSRLVRAEQEAVLYREKLKNIESRNYDHRGTSSAAIHLERTIERAAKVDAPVLLLGETGTGKTMSATNIHDLSNRRNDPFITINCGAIPADLLEAELFGYEPGAFSGASEKGKPGMFELAENGTLFLDEIAELPLQMQVKLLHVLDGVGYRRLGGVKQFIPDVRIIAATNKELTSLVEEGTFREDLFFRLRVLVVNIPPLRERKEDIPSLINHFLAQANEKYGLYKTMSIGLINLLMNNRWPGNVRELRASIELLVAMSENNLIDVDELPDHHMRLMPEEAASVVKAFKPKSLKVAVEELEERMIREALLEGKSTYKAAKLLQTSQSTIVRKAQRYNINSEVISL
ncbi:sigma-54 interaction domain-containing protein [Desulfosediminicola ganghwensis]|uniref:sigma-54 interaction domain-containing protein n=1 Tax=Desulfosediminicola ganghwensis TaxID=2569540 RepID=UPI0010AD175C|nr:sigma 54-interacting transcriptional regulator [Desulfosediminicola ganghwensis]